MLAHRLRVLLHTLPLAGLHRSNALRDPELRHYDGLALGLATIDLIIDHMGLDTDVDRARVASHLAPLLEELDRIADKRPDPERHAAMADRVVAALRNDDDRRRPFEARYLDVEGDRLVHRVREFRLVYDQFHPEGGTVLRLSNEAVNLFLGALELPIEDAQAAAEAIVQSQLARGRLEEALESAQRAHLQSIRYKAKLERVLLETRRDVTSLDWRVEVPRLLDEALAHVSSRLLVEQTIVNTAAERLDVLEDGDERGVIVARIGALARECMLLHTALQAPLMRARNVFLEEQARQRYVTPPITARPELVREVLEPVLAMPAADALPVVEAVQPVLYGARPPLMLSLRTLVDWQLRRRRETAPSPSEVTDPDLAERTLDPTRFPEDIRAVVRELLAGLRAPCTLSELLETLRAQGASPETIDALALAAGEAFAEQQPNSVERSGERFETGGWFGDDLVISPARPG
jgi:tetratricopeptide (TPR) repeat protein